MKFNVVFSCICLCLAACNAEGKRDAQISVISFNVRLDNPVDGDNRWDNRRQAAAAMVNREQPTLLGLQEAQPHQITYLANHCPGYGWYGIGRETGKVPPATDTYAPEETMVIMWREADVELLDKGTFWLSPTPDTLSKGWDAYCNRTCAWCLFRHKASGREFYFFNTHLDHIGKTARAESMKLIVEQMEKINDRHLTVFLTADFNSRTTNACFDPLHACMQDARAQAHETDNQPTWNGYGVKSSPNWLDHIFFAGDHCVAMRFRTLTDDYGVPYISDHYPVEALFRLGK